MKKRKNKVYVGGQVDRDGKKDKNKRKRMLKCGVEVGQKKENKKRVQLGREVGEEREEKE